MGGGRGDKTSGAFLGSDKAHNCNFDSIADTVSVPMPRKLRRLGWDEPKLIIACAVLCLLYMRIVVCRSVYSLLGRSEKTARVVDRVKRTFYNRLSHQLLDGSMYPILVALLQNMV